MGSPETMKKAVKHALDKWYERMIGELDALPEKIEEMGRSCSDRYSQARTR